MVLQRCLFLKSVSSSMCLLDVIFGRLKRGLDFDSFFFFFVFLFFSTPLFRAIVLLSQFHVQFSYKNCSFCLSPLLCLASRLDGAFFCIVIWHNLHAVMNGKLAWTGRRETIHSKKRMFFLLINHKQALLFYQYVSENLISFFGWKWFIRAGLSIIFLIGIFPMQSMTWFTHSHIMSY